MTTTSAYWKTYTTISLIGLAAITVLAAWTEEWVLAAIPVGFLFGFFLQKGDLCGSSAFSEVLVLRDRSKVVGLWILIVVAMLGFGLLDSLGWVVLSPKPLLYWSYLVGGTLFGVGMVLAGGCVSGCLYKAATGNLNSIVALLMIPAGVMLVEFGPLKPLHEALRVHVLNTSSGERLSLHTLTSLPFSAWALVFAIATASIAFRRLRGKSTRDVGGRFTGSVMERCIARPWKPWQAGIAIGLLMVPAYLSSAASGRNYPLGVTHGVMQAELLLIDSNFSHVYRTPTATVSPAQGQKPGLPPPGGKRVVWWLVLLILSLMLGSWVSARLSGRARLLAKPPDELLFALLGGVLVGTGAALATGCVVGNIMSGWALLSIGMFFFGIVTILANWVTTYFYLMGGSLGR